MSGLLTFLLYAALFYLMMRFGCGAHSAHRHDAHGQPGNRSDDSNKS